MSILIEGMEMPKNCSNCNWSRYSFPDAQCSMTHHKVDIEVAKNGRPDDCPLVEVPEPHGRLIDESTALNARYENMNWVYDVHDLEPFLSEIPTVIPAEDGE